MHDLDRTFRETDSEDYEYEEFSFEEELPGGTYDRPFSEAELDELALELLSVQSEQELDQFLGGLFKRATKALTCSRTRIIGVGSFKSSVGRQK